MRVIVSDTSPIRYLVLIGEADLLEKLYSRILIPRAVYEELQQPATPDVVRDWAKTVPAWVEVIPDPSASAAFSISSALDSGERSAIALALDWRADLLLMDERAGAREARRLGLTVIGTLGVLVRGAERGYIELPAALAKLQRTNFRAAPEILRKLLLEDDGLTKPTN
jgi:predicted nucleic acid-binding protein